MFRKSDAALFYGLLLPWLSKTHTGAAAVLVDEFDAGTLQRGLNPCTGLAPATQGTIIRFKPFNCRQRDVGSQSQLLL